jgi:L-fuculose-phosphate aldolase
VSARLTRVLPADAPRREAALRRAICDVTRHLYDRGHGAPGDGNVSVRLSPTHLLCTPTMAHKGRLTPSQIVKVRAADGVPVSPRQRASTEIRLHLALYAARPGLGAIVHAHSPYTVALSVAGLSLDDLLIPEAVVALAGGCPTVPYASPTTADVPAAVLAHAPRAPAFVLERHGPVALGVDLADALARLEVIEHTAKITLLARTVGTPVPLPEAELAKLRALVPPPAF